MGQGIGDLDSGLTITWATTQHHPPMKECSGKKVLIVKVAQNDPLDSYSRKIDLVDSEIKDVG